MHLNTVDAMDGLENKKMGKMDDNDVKDVVTKLMRTCLS